MNKFWHASIFLVLVVAFQSCTKFKPAEVVGNALASLDGFRQQSNSCFEDQENQACIVSKSPMSALDGVTAAAVGSNIGNHVNDLMVMPAEITGVDGSGFLQNSTISIETAAGDRAQAVNGQWKFNHGEDGRYVQVHTYFWLNHTLSQLQSRTGVSYLDGEGVRVILNSERTGWSSGENSIQLERNGGRNAGLDASLSVHLLGHANLHHATNGSIYAFSPGSHRNCEIGDGPTYVNDCCTSRLGCAKAIASGQADYLVAIMFPEDPSIGETWSYRKSGMNACDLSRDVTLHVNTSVDQAFNHCESQGAQGQIFNMGTIYASIWWEIRKSLPEGDKNEFDTLYMEHLAELNGSDNFRTAFDKVLTLDSDRHGGKFGNNIQSELNRRGL